MESIKISTSITIHHPVVSGRNSSWCKNSSFKSQIPYTITRMMLARTICVNFGRLRDTIRIYIKSESRCIQTQCVLDEYSESEYYIWPVANPHEINCFRGAYLHSDLGRLSLELLTSVTLKAWTIICAKQKGIIQWLIAVTLFSEHHISIQSTYLLVRLLKVRLLDLDN